MAERDKEWDLHFRTLSSMARDSSFASDRASDPSPLNSVKKLHELCEADNSEDLIARVYPQVNKIFQHSVASISQSRTSNGLLLLSNGMVTFDALLSSVVSGLDAIICCH
ncbi:hypothetical protein RHGRI_025612 [Rhododendron griersonianum]|uniref:AP-5 complex subunit zeta-1 ARM repeats domain-containing protein n=1 Tax=Rhododendron griersonianum TaxID=479676 RepID=A0AAV6IV61_9ERIC|nr:hypothetical protein RHGRI_025612 [Rhododendron griersonianum]